MRKEPMYGVSVRLPSELYRRIEKTAAERGVSLSDFLRPLVADTMSKRAENPFLDRELMGHAANLVTVISELSRRYDMGMAEMEGDGFDSSTATFVERCRPVIAQGVMEFLRILFGGEDSPEDDGVEAKS